MHRLTVLYPPAPEPDHFRRYYVDVHLPLAARLPGLRATTYALDITTMDGSDPFAAIWDGDFESREAMDAALASAEGQAVVMDVSHFSPMGAQIIHYSVAEPARSPKETADDHAT